MFLILVFLFVAIPVAELSILIRVTQDHGLGTTIAIVFATGVIGAALARWQGVSTVRKIQQRMASGQMPATEMFDGALILVAGAVLLTPGLLTDAFGFSLLIPPVRRLLGRGLVRFFRNRVQVQTFGVPPGFQRDPRSTADADGSAPPGRGTVIDTEFVESEPDE